MRFDYVGNGSYIQGVPARNLSEAESEQFENVIRQQEAATGLVLYVSYNEAEDNSDMDKVKNDDIRPISSE